MWEMQVLQEQKHAHVPPEDLNKSDIPLKYFNGLMIQKLKHNRVDIICWRW
jgi:hypothetical protein